MTMCRLLLVLSPTLLLVGQTRGGWRRRRGGSSSRVDCTWGGWSEWSDCSRHCGSSGRKSRSRGISRSSSCGGSSCSGPSSQTEACNRFLCCPSVNCAWSSWSAWGVCNHRCGNAGRQSRSRGIARSAYCGGSGCSGPSRQTQDCNRFCDKGGIPHHGYCGNFTDEVWGTCCDKHKYTNSSSMGGSKGCQACAFILAGFLSSSKKNLLNTARRRPPTFVPQMTTCLTNKLRTLPPVLPKHREAAPSYTCPSDDDMSNKQTKDIATSIAI